jgi:CO dehydrogenase/acetyl-CoA synthase beta subunit
MEEEEEEEEEEEKKEEKEEKEKKEPAISLPVSQRYPKYRTATLLLVLENRGLLLLG